MGVPGFFKWLWNNYRNTNFVFGKGGLDPEIDKILINQINNLDYLLIDANCLIHPVCFKTLDDNPNEKNLQKLEGKMRINVIEYIEKIINYVQPKKGIYLAIDGVAPVAKIKQQRSRRFKSVSDRKLFDNIRRKHKKEIPLFWNNSAISPGTTFMRKLHLHIENWKSEYSKKHNLNIIYSSCYTPSEGEHKLLQFIRNNIKNRKKFTYIMYGLDADLIFLTLSTGLKNTFLLREAQQFNKKANKDELNFVSINIMRTVIVETLKKQIKDNDSYIEEEFDFLMKNLNETNIIDDFIFICVLMGNDFLPHLPSLDIYEGGVDYLIEKYVEILLDNFAENLKIEYLIKRNSTQKINQVFFNKLIDELAIDEEQILKENYGKKTRFYKCGSSDPFDKEMHRIQNLQFKINDPILLGKDSMKEWKPRYFDHYFKIKEKDIEKFSKDMVYHYYNGLKWVTEYYFDKCPSWNWYFPYDHPPFLEDISKYKINFKEINFKLGTPLLPYQQLLCILPKQSAYLLPKSLQNLMIDNSSCLSHLYPSKFEQDFINKKQYWMGIPKLPDLDIELVKNTYENHKHKIKNFEKNNNLVI